MIQELEETNITFTYNSLDKVTKETLRWNLMQNLQYLLQYSGWQMNMQEVANVLAWLDFDPTKLFKKEKAEEFMKYFENIGEKLTAVLSGASWIDIANKTESKGNAIKAICEKYGIAHTEAMGFGDYLNDMSLLESCGESYCMKNGHPTLKALAKYVTEKTNDENGVMEVLKTL